MTQEAKSPFIEKSVKCPVCGRFSPQRSFLSRMFTPKTVESDHHVVSYTWLNQNVKRAHPPHYFLYYCPYCFYTDISDDFSNSNVTPSYRKTLKSFNSAGEKQKQLINLMGKHVHYDEIDFASALNLHFLAIFGQMLPPKKEHDCYKIARLLLRVAWLYRENKPNDSDSLHIPSVEEILEGMKILEIETDKARKSWDKVSKAVERRTGELEKEFQTNAAENPYARNCADLGKQFDNLVGELYRLKTTCKRDLSGKLLSGDAYESGPFFSFPSYEAFFEKLKSVWPLAPADEMEAMRAAIAYFKHSVSTDSRFDDPEKHFSAITLITDLMIRCDDIDAALAAIGTIHKTALDSRQKYMKKMQEKDIDEQTKRRFQVQIQRTNAALGRAVDLRYELLDNLLKRDLPKIKKILAKHEGAPTEEIEKILKKNGIVEPLILRMQEEGGLLEGPKKKKRRFF